MNQEEKPHRKTQNEVLGRFLWGLQALKIESLDELTELETKGEVKLATVQEETFFILKLNLRKVPR